MPAFSGLLMVYSRLKDYLAYIFVFLHNRIYRNIYNKKHNST